MGELVDILDDQGLPTGKTALKSEAHRLGLYHPTVHIWFYTRDARLLIQQRGRNKKSFPLLWDVSVAGHIAAGESAVEAGIREVEEEIGLCINAEMLEEIGVFKSAQDHGPDFSDREFHHTYMAELRVPLQNLKKQESEVEDLALIPLLQFAEENWGLARTDKYVPHEISYYKAVIQAVRDRLK